MDDNVIKANFEFHFKTMTDLDKAADFMVANGFVIENANIQSFSPKKEFEAQQKDFKKRFEEAVERTAEKELMIESKKFKTIALSVKELSSLQETFESLEFDFDDEFKVEFYFDEDNDLDQVIQKNSEDDSVELWKVKKEEEYYCECYDE